MTLGKVDFELPIDSLRGMLMRSDPYYFRRYPKTGGGVMHIVQARPNRKGHIPSEAETENRKIFAIKYAQQRHQEYIDKIFKNQLEIKFED